jgi:DNA polymerase elongation subunit (family B)
MVSLAFCCTQQGVHRIQRVIRFVEEDTPEQKVIYGDTDSIFVFIPKTHPCQGWLRARELHDRIHDEKNKIMDRDTKMELENVSATMHALCKKKYILEILSKTAYERCATCGSGIPWHLEEDSGHLKPRSLKIQGVLNRSIPIYTQNLIKETYKRKYLLAQSPMKIYLWLRAELQKIKRGEVQRDEFRQSKCLSKPLSEYKGEQVHTRCAKMLQEAGIEVKVGDRIGYYTCIVAASSKKSQTCVPDELVDSFTIDWMQYLRDMLQTFEKVGFVDILGSGLFSNLQFVVQNGQTVGKISVGKRTETTGSFEDICRKRARPSLN